jgi:hypothetical protein
MLTLTGLSRRIQSMRCTQILDFEQYASESTLLAYGFGSVPASDADPQARTSRRRAPVAANSERPYLGNSDRD